MAQTKKNIVDSIINVANRFNVTDEQRLDPDWMSYKINQVRAELVQKQYAQTQEIDRAWISPSFQLNVTETNYADNIISISCDNKIGKTSIPQVISLYNTDASIDIGVYSLISMCGNRFRYSFKPRQFWGYIPHESVYSKFRFYDRIGTTVFISSGSDNILPQKVLFTGILLNPEDGYLTNSTPVASGSLVNGTTYYVANGQIIYNGAVVAEGTTFVANATTTFITNTGTVYPNSQITQYADTDPYPASGDMIRQIEIEILTKELGIEKGQLTDVRNDSKDDSIKQVAL